MQPRTALCSAAAFGLLVFVAPADAGDISVTGTYLQGFECGVIDVDDGGSFQMFGTYPEDGLQTGDRIQVTGTVDENCLDDPILPIALCGLPCIVDAEINLIVEDVCGQIHPGPQNCLLVSGEEQSFIFNDDLQGAGMLDHVRVTGVLVEESSLCFPVITTTLDVISVSPCVDGDVTRNGDVDVDDVVSVILKWGTDDYWADTTRDGQVNVDDLIDVITKYGNTM